MAMPVFLVRVTPIAGWEGCAASYHRRSAVDANSRTGLGGDRSEMGPKLDDFVITKHQWGAFYGTELIWNSAAAGSRTMVLCGIATNIGVESTARFAYEYGYHQIFAEDAMAAMSAEEHAVHGNRKHSRALD